MLALLAQISGGHLFQKAATTTGPNVYWKGRFYRTNEELVFRPHEISSKLIDQDFQILAKNWNIHPVVEEGAEQETSAFFEKERGYRGSSL